MNNPFLITSETEEKPAEVAAPAPPPVVASSPIAAAPAPPSNPFLLSQPEPLTIETADMDAWPEDVRVDTKAVPVEAKDSKPFDLLDVPRAFGKQLGLSAMALIPDSISGYARNRWSSLGPTGALVRDDKGNFITTTTAPAGVEDYRLWRDTLAQLGDRVVFTDMDTAEFVNRKIKKSDPYLTEDTARYYAEQKEMQEYADAFEIILNPTEEDGLKELMRVWEGEGELERGAKAEAVSEEIKGEAAYERGETEGVTQFAGDVGASLGASLVSAIPAIVTRGAGGAQLGSLGIMGVLAGNTKEAEAAAQGEDILTAKRLKAIKQLSEPGTEMLPMGALFENKTNLAKRLVNFLVQEVPGEILETTIDDFATWALANPEKPADQFLGEWWDHVVDTALIAPFAGGAQVMTAHTADKAITWAEEKVPKAIEFAKGKILPEDPAFTVAKQKVQEGASGLREQEEKAKFIEAALEELNRKASEFDLNKARESIPDLPGLFTSNIPELHTFANERQSEAGRDQAHRIMKSMVESLPVRTEAHAEEAGSIEKLGIEPGQVVLIGKTEAEELHAQIRERMDDENATAVWTEENWQDAKEQLAKMETAQAEQQKIAQEYLDFAQSIVDKYIPDAHVFLNVGNEPRINKGLSATGTTRAFQWGTTGNRELYGQPEAYLIGLQSDLARAENREMGYQAIAHELGHAIVSRAFSKMLKAKPNLINLVKKAYAEKLRKGMKAADTNRAPGFAEFMYGPHRAEKIPLTSVDNYVRELDAWGTFGYMMGLEEFGAESMVKSWLGKGEVQKELDEALKEVGKPLKDLWQKLQKEGMQTEESYEDFLKATLYYDDLLKAKAHRSKAKMRLKASVADLKRLSPKWMSPETVDKLIEGLLADGGNQVEQALLSGTGNGGKGGSPYTVREQRKKIQSDLTKFTWVTRLFAGIVQVKNMNPQIESLQNFARNIGDFWITKSRWTDKAVTIAKDWMKHTHANWLETDHKKRFDAMLVEADQMSDEKGRRLKAEELQALLAKHNLGEEDLAIMNRVWQLYTDALTEIEEALLKQINSAYAHMENPDFDAMKEEMQELQRDFARMRNRNYMPHTRFGKYRTTVRAKEAVAWGGQKFKKGQIILYTGRDTLLQHKELQKWVGVQFANKEFEVTTNEVLDDNLQTFQGLPPDLALRIGRAIKLDKAQMDKLTELVVKSAPGQSVRKHMLKRKGIPGYEGDALRAFSDYFSRFSSHVARVKHSEDLENDIALAKQERKAIKGKGVGDLRGRKRDRLINWMQGTYDYLMNPGEEWANLRSAGFFWYLAFGAKSAVVNTLQVPMVTYPYLAARFGDVATTREMARSMKQVTDHFRGKVMKGSSGLPADIQAMWQELKARQLLDEGMTTMLVGVANDRTLFNIPTKGGFAHGIRLMSQAGGFMFQTAEKMNRYYTATSAYNLAKRSGKTQEEATNIAAEAVQNTQLEYSRFNRPEIMRGKKSVIFLFYQYVTQMMYFVGSDPGRWRYLAMMLLATGYTGLPGAENILDLADGFITKFKKQFGMSNPKVQLRVEIAKVVNDLFDDVTWMPENSAALVEDGLMGDLWGYNLQSSLSLGNIFMLDTSVFSTEGTGEGKVGQAVESLAGAPAQVALNLMYAVASPDPLTWRSMEKLLPVFAQKYMQAKRRYEQQEERTPSGQMVTRWDTENPYGMTERIMESIGFPLTEVQRKREAKFWANDAVRFYAGLERNVRNEFYALQLREDSADPPDDQEWERFEKGLDKYNNMVKDLDPRLTLSHGTLMKSYTQRMKAEIQDENLGHRQRKYQEISQDVLDARM